MTAVLRRLPFALACGVALFIAVVALAASQLEAASSGDELIEEAAPFLTDEGLSSARADLERIDATLTVMAADPAFAEKVAGDPALAESAARLPEVGASADKVISNLEERQGEFDSAADLPGAGLDLRQAVVGLLLVAGAVFVAGAVGVVRPNGWAAGVVLVAGVVIAGPPLALGHLAKAQDTDALLDSLRPFSAEKVEARENGLADVQLVVGAYDGTAVPADDLAETAEAINRFAELVEFSRYAQPRLVEATTLSATTTTTLAISEGAALALAGVTGLLAARRRSASRLDDAARPSPSSAPARPPGTEPI